MYRRILVRLDDGETVKTRVDRDTWKALAVGDTWNGGGGGLIVGTRAILFAGRFARTVLPTWSDRRRSARLLVCSRWPIPSLSL